MARDRCYLTIIKPSYSRGQNGPTYDGGPIDHNEEWGGTGRTTPVWHDGAAGVVERGDQTVVIGHDGRQIASYPKSSVKNWSF